MKTRAFTTRHEPVTSEVRLIHHRQSLIVALPRQTRLVVTEGAVQLAFADPSIDWLGTSPPIRRIMLRGGDSYLVEQACHATVSGAQAGLTEFRLEVSVAPGPLARLRAWFAGREAVPRTATIPYERH